MCDHLKSIATFGQHWTEVIGIIDEKQHISELITAVQFGLKPSCRLYRCRRKEVDVEDFVCM